MNHADQLKRLFSTNRVSHAYLITGPGRKSFGEALAAALVCEREGPPCGNCPHCKKAAGGIHPDVIRISPEEGKREIFVDQIRDMRSDVYVRPNEAHRKVYLIDPASQLNQSAQNALLKVLEEGPAYAVFLLLSENGGTLLPTVRSRCEEYFLSSDEEEEVSTEEGEFLAHLLLSGEEYELLCHCVSLEKLNREQLRDLFDQTALALKKKIRQHVHEADVILPIIELLDQLQEAAGFHTGVGHLLGWLCAETVTWQNRRKL